MDSWLKINSGTLWYYNLSPENAITVRYVILLKEEVDGEALKKAVGITMTRYPYLMLRIVADGKGYHLEKNDLPIVVLNTSEPITLCGTQANGHQIALSYEGCAIYFNNTHAIFDGRGRSAMLHTLIYYYCKFRYNEDVDMPGVYLAGSEVDSGEYADPFDGNLPSPVVELPSLPKHGKAMNLSGMGLVRSFCSQIHRVRINEKQLMSLCKSNDATPNTAVSLLMCHAIDRLHPDSCEPIVAGVYCDLRSALRTPKTHQCLVTTLDLEYDRSMRDMDFSEQNTIFRGKMLLLSEESMLLASQRDIVQLSAQINALPTLEDKIKTAQAAMAGVFRSHTFSVSYSGKSSYGSCDKHIAALFPQPQAVGCGILMEITAADGWFYITFIQEWREDVYFDAFIKEIIARGLDFDLLYSAQSRPAGFSLE